MVCVWTMVKGLRNLSSFVTEARKSKIATVVASRTNSVAVLLENIVDEGNENAILRTMDALGFQCLHRVKESSLRPKKAGRMRTDKGARKWIKIHDWTDVGACIRHLKEEGGYHIAVATPNAEVPISKLDFCHQKLVLAFGNETRGVSERLTQLSDTTFSLPMCGFVQSFNVSVSAAIALYHAYTQRVQKLGGNGDLTEQEQQELAQFYINPYQTTL